MKILTGLVVSWSLALATAAVSAAGHVVEIDQPVLVPENGLLLGNGDLSVSIYQATDQIIWRFGKNDVWDRRIDRGDDPKPAHIDEVAHGLEVEGWKCPPVGTTAEALRGTKNPQRMRELCQGVPPSYEKRPYPNPKPVGELALHLPPDLPGLQVHQRLKIEEATVTIECSWSLGVKLVIESFVAPKPNALAVRWRLENWTDRTRMGRNDKEYPPVWFSLRRWPDPSRLAFAEPFRGASRNDVFVSAYSGGKSTPLAPPQVKREADCWTIEQTFAPEPTFRSGFRYLLTPLVPADVGIESVAMTTSGEARLHLIPTREFTQGQVVVAVTTSSDPGGPAQELQRIGAEIRQKMSETIDGWAEQNGRSAAAFWSHSKVSIGDPMLENLWYETFHARRCAYRRGTPPPGLFLPSTVNDYSHWHGDYHWNYNIQEPFWGDYTANQLDVGDSYFDAMKDALEVGRKIARDYYGCRGAFIQLTTYPIRMEVDPLGCVPMGRMAYMTGWAMHQYWWRYLYTLDKDWLRSVGYPVIRDCALFYTDFMKRRADGLYHVFPSNQGEDGFSGDPKDYTDRAQVMQHARYCLRAAIAASEALGIDEELRAAWRDRLEHAAGDDGKPLPVLTGLEKVCYEAGPPEFGRGAPYRPQPESVGSHTPRPLDYYFGAYAWQALIELRTGEFVAARDFSDFRRMTGAWRRPNGLRSAMAVVNYGRAGGWTESLGIVAPLQDMMLQSWDGALRVCSAWPKDVDARFESLRAEGAFLVTAAWSKGQVTELSIRSEKGAPCTLYAPWLTGIRVRDAAGNAVAVTADAYGRPQFATRPGAAYRVEPR
jgi:alpha-L-fucosidase 2